MRPCTDYLRVGNVVNDLFGHKYLASFLWHLLRVSHQKPLVCNVPQTGVSDTSLANTQLLSNVAISTNPMLILATVLSESKLDDLLARLEAEDNIWSLLDLVLHVGVIFYIHELLSLLGWFDWVNFLYLWHQRLLELEHPICPLKFGTTPFLHRCELSAISKISLNFFCFVIKKYLFNLVTNFLKFIADVEIVLIFNTKTDFTKRFNKNIKNKSHET